jgi:conjugative transfer signal peptidase TraF
MDSAGVWVNEVLWPHSRTLDNDSLGRPLQVSAPLEPNVPEDAVLLMSDDSPTSFDARYFGLVDRRQIQAVIRPVLTW